MSIQLNELQEKKHSLRRAPPPKAPSIKPSLKKKPLQNQDNDIPITQLIPGVKLKKTGIRDSLIAEDVDNKHIGRNTSTDKPENELLSAIAKRRAKFEKIEDKQEIKPKPKPKPKPRSQHEDKEKVRNLSSSSDDSGKENSTDENKNVLCRDSKGEPKLCILPTLDSLGKPPAKPVKPENMVELLGKYNRADIVIARRRTTLIREAENSLRADDVIVEGNEEQEDYDDVDDELKAQILGKADCEQKEQTLAEEDSGILDENYDDVDAVAEKALEINKKLDEVESPEAICEESYDDLDIVAEQVQIQLKNDAGETFGDEMYEAVSAKREEQNISGDNGFDSPRENRSSPSATPSPQPKEKGKKDLRKESELQKKREREEQKKKKEEEKRREKEEREEKRKKEEEKKKRERDDKELRKKHKLKPGSEGTGVGEAKSNFAGDGKFELPVKEGGSLTIISENGCPPGKWLVKNGEGHLGYVPAELIQLKIDKEGNRVSAIITEDFYEEVDKYQSAGQIEEEDDDQEVYDDIGGIDEDFYEELPADQ